MKSILLVDDSDTILLSLSTILTASGYNVNKANSAKKALDWLLSGGQADLMITDLNMPEMDGIALITEIRKSAIRQKMPILILTTESQQSKRDQAKAAGAKGWLVKPVVATDLLQVVEKVLSL